jgi:signal transduction histidine kinase
MMSGDDEQATTSEAASAGERRWNLMAQLHDELLLWHGNYPSLAQRVAEIVAYNIGDGAVVILSDLPGQEEPVVGFTHTDPNRAEFGLKLLHELGAEGLSEWVRQFRGQEGRVHRSAFFEDPVPPRLAAIDEYRRRRGLVDTAYAPLHSILGQVRGLVGCTREEGSPPFESFDLSALASAADTLNVGVQLALERSKAEVFKFLAQSSPDFVAIAGADGNVDFINDAGRSLVGLPKDIDITTTTLRDYYTSSAQTIDQVVASWPRRDHSTWEGNSTLRDWRDGSEIAVSVRTFTIADIETREPNAIATVQRDMRPEIATRRAIADLAEQRRILLSELVNAEQAERERIAQDVHDDSIQLLAAAALRSQLMLNQLEANSAAHTTASAIGDLLHSAQGSLRRLLLDLEPATGPDRKFDDAMRQVVDAFFADSTTTVTISGTLTELPSEVAAVLHRAAREAVSNARRHAVADNVTVHLSEDDTYWRVTVEDDGIGMPVTIPARPGHLGLKGMRSRIEALGGRVAITSRPGGGTQIVIEVPRTR